MLQNIYLKVDPKIPKPSLSKKFVTGFSKYQK